MRLIEDNLSQRDMPWKFRIEIYKKILETDAFKSASANLYQRESTKSKPFSRIIPFLQSNR